MLSDHKSRLRLEFPRIKKILDPVIHGLSDQLPHQILLNCYKVHVALPHPHVLAQNVLSLFFKGIDHLLNAESSSVLLLGLLFAVKVLHSRKELFV